MCVAKPFVDFVREVLDYCTRVKRSVDSEHSWNIQCRNVSVTLGNKRIKCNKNLDTSVKCNFINIHCLLQVVTCFLFVLDKYLQLVTSRPLHQLGRSSCWIFWSRVWWQRGALSRLWRQLLTVKLKVALGRMTKRKQQKAKIKLLMFLFFIWPSICWRHHQHRCWVNFNNCFWSHQSYSGLTSLRPDPWQ